MQKAVFASILLGLSAAIASPAQTYHLTDLGTLGGSDSRGYGINSYGQVVGQSSNASGSVRAFLYTWGGSMQAIGTLGGSESIAWGVNDLNQIVGEGSFVGGGGHAFRYDGSMHDLGTFYGDSEAMGLNNTGLIVGFSETQTDGDHPFVYDGSTMTDLGIGPGVANSVNDSGQITGEAGQSIFLRTGTSTVFLGSGGGGPSMRPGTSRAFSEMAPIRPFSTTGRYSIPWGRSPAEQRPTAKASITATSSSDTRRYPATSGMASFLTDRASSI